MVTSVQERQAKDTTPDATTLIARAQAMIPALKERAG